MSDGTAIGGAIAATEQNDPLMAGGKPGHTKAVSRVSQNLTTRTGSIIALVIGVLWTIPTAGLLINSFRSKEGQQQSGFWTLKGPFTLDLYHGLLFGNSLDGEAAILPNIVNSLAITIPATIIPIAVACMASYALVWIEFRGRDWIFVTIFALQVVPIQVCVVPLLRFLVTGWHFGHTAIFPSTGAAGTLAAIWIAHSCFALPLAVFLIHNFMSEIPKDLLEAARIDGASHGQIFRQVMFPLLTPALAAFGILQFLFVWNDLFVGLIMGSQNTNPVTVAIGNLVSNTSGTGQEYLPAAGFLAIIIPLIVFMSLQRFFVRGLLAGSVKG
jgi:alpha-glucoside transport system permease protein